MRATLIHNPNSGGALTEDELVARLRGIGWDVHACAEKSDVGRCIGGSTDVFVVAGGDGTVGKIARMLAGREVPLAILPTGTANNVARSLGVDLDLERAIRGLARSEERRVDLGSIATASSTGDADLFIEGFGIGVFARSIGKKHDKAKKKKKLDKAINFLAGEVETFKAQDIEISIDGRDASGAYVLVAVMNMQSFGPALGLAPNARWDDGELDVVLVTEARREALLAHLRAADQGLTTPEFEARRARSVRVRAVGRWAHADDRTWVLDDAITIEARPGAVRVLLPRAA